MAGPRLIREDSQLLSLLHPLRREILVELREPGSATSVAERLGLPRQKVNYHVRQLEAEGLVEQVSERRRGNCVERTVRAAAPHFLPSPSVLGDLAATPGRVADRGSGAYLMAVLGRALEEVADPGPRSDPARDAVALDTRVHLPDAGARKAFADDMARAVTEVIARHHRPEVEGGTDFRLVMGGWVHAAKPVHD